MELHKQANFVKDNGNLLPCVVQDPRYSNLDKRFPRSLDFTVVDGPDAFSLINANSLVFSYWHFPLGAWWICDGIWLRRWSLKKDTTTQHLVR
jgi:hypothetical protein